ncbi:hypothetical protein B0T17DRAFT_260377 [Bombardia bombarda]|uniref:Uncharacterized protein n=1 Tax=Bombardia bombarda TaxID=252184 RepID=A0AA39X147_9PEZI|nr:hypothetical protein B0T17DRAFT_260377 [Bombardia bombarda]
MQLSIFLVLRVHFTVTRRQIRRLLALFGTFDFHESVASWEALDELSRVLQNQVSSALDDGTILPRSAERLLLSQIFHGIAADPAPSYEELQDKFTYLECDICATMVRGRVWGSQFLNLALSASNKKSTLGLERRALLGLKSLWKELEDSAPQLETKFNCKFMPLIKMYNAGAGGVSFPHALICGSWGCEIESQRFVNLSFLWNWISAVLPTFLEEDATITWLSTPASVVKMCLDHAWPPHKSGAALLDPLPHIVALIAGQEELDAATLFELKETGMMNMNTYGRTAIHYAAAAGNMSVCLAWLEFPLTRDDDGQLPIFYAARNGHLEVVKYLNKYL